MKVFSLYDSVTGEVIGTGAVANDADIASQGSPGIAVFPDVRLDRETQKIDLSGQTPRVVSK